MSHKQIAISVIIPIAVAAIMILPWAALQGSYAQSDIASTILKTHNDERTAVGVPDLVWSDSLATDAKSWAEHLASLPPKPSSQPYWNQCCGGEPDLVHAKVTGQGENLWAGSAGGYSTADSVQSWAKEKDHWNSDTKTCASGEVCGHYTQMVWKNTEKVGCASAIGNHGKFEFLVCRYSPPGNYNGENPY